MEERIVWTADELLAADFPEPTGEEEYRRGYRDGWIAATNAASDFTIQAMYQHWTGALLEWEMSRRAEFVLPPECQVESVC